MVEYKRGVDVPLEEGELITGTRLMEITGCTKKQFMTFCGQGLIRAAKKTRKGWALFDEKAVHAILDHQKKQGVTVNGLLAPDPSYTREQAIAVITRIKQGARLDDILLEVKIHPRMLRGIMKEYENLSSAVIIEKAMLDQINELPLEGTFPIKNALGLYEVLRLAADESKCKQCRKRSASQMCSQCERRRVLKNLSVREPRPMKANGSSPEQQMIEDGDQEEDDAFAPEEPKWPST